MGPLFSAFVDVTANWMAEGLGWLLTGLVLLLGLIAWGVIAGRRHRERLAKAQQQAVADQHYRAELRNFVLAPAAELNEALNTLRWEMMQSYTGPNKDSLNELFGQHFELAIRRQYGNLERLVQAEAPLPTIEEALQIYINYYRGEPAMLRRYITLSGQLADAALWQKWLDADERFFRAFRNLKASPRASPAFANHLATATDTKDLAINKPW